jgi:hypothetical protein
MVRIAKPGQISHQELPSLGWRGRRHQTPIRMLRVSPTNSVLPSCRSATDVAVPPEQAAWVCEKAVSPVESQRRQQDRRKNHAAAIQFLDKMIEADISVSSEFGLRWPGLPGFANATALQRLLQNLVLFEAYENSRQSFRLRCGPFASSGRNRPFVRIAYRRRDIFTTCKEKIIRQPDNMANHGFPVFVPSARHPEILRKVFPGIPIT